jgi:hypothetical protein
MKKILTMMVSIAIALTCSVMALATSGTANNWYADLTFSTTNSTDKFPVRIGEGTTADSVMKPPAVPGQKYSASFAPVIRASVLTSDSVQAAQRIDIKDVSSPAKIWTLTVETEESNVDVSMKIDSQEFYSAYYPVSVIVPKTGDYVQFTADGQQTKVFTSDDTGSMVVYVMAGSNQTFVAANGTAAFGATRFVKGTTMAPGVSLYNFGSCGTGDLSGCTPIATTGTSGIFPAFTLPAGSNTLRLDAPNVIGEKFNITVAAGTTIAVPVGDLYKGDVNDDGTIDTLDVLPVKKCYNLATTATYEVGSSTKSCAPADVNGDSSIDTVDVLPIKIGYQQTEDWPQ